MRGNESDVIILGGGVAGLAAASDLHDRAIILEANDRPGRPVRSECFCGGYWFDRVLHLLHFSDQAIETRIRPLFGADLLPRPPLAFVETTAGTSRFPIQLNLFGLEVTAKLRILEQLAKITFQTDKRTAANYEEMLLRSFGKDLCELFFYPYNRKMWKRPLRSLASSGFTWNIVRPDFSQALAGALSADAPLASYNTNAWYPQPPAASPVRGMELLSRKLAESVRDLRLGHKVIALSTEQRRVFVQTKRGQEEFKYRSHLISTVALPWLIQMCQESPNKLKNACRTLPRNRVTSVALCIRGSRPTNRGLWRYYTDESLCFTRLIYMHEFDPLSAPEDGWGLLAEIPEPAETSLRDPAAVFDRVRKDVQRIGALRSNDVIIGEHIMIADPAYVVFTPEAQRITHEARVFAENAGIRLLGRYGRWEYSSISQAIADGFKCATELFNSGFGDSI